MEKDILTNFDEDGEFNEHDNYDSQDEDDETLNSTEIAGRNDEIQLENPDITTDDNDLKEFSSVLFSKSLKDMNQKFKVISIECYSTNVNISSKFSKIEKFKNVKKYKVQCVTCNSKVTCFPSSAFNMTRHFKSCSVKTPKQPIQKTMQKKIRINSLRERVKNFLLSTAVPFTTIINPSFCDLLQENPNRIPAINTIKNDIKREYQETLNSMKEYFNKSDFVCLTADCWTTYNRTFIGITCLLFDYDGEDEYCKKRFMLACKRVTDSVTFDVIAEVLSSVINDFDLNEKVVCVITDGGSNFIKAFRIYNANEVTQIITTASNDQEIADYSETVHSISQIEANVDSEQTFALPPRIPCFAHILNLIGSKDVLKSLDDQSEYDIIYEKVMLQFKALWNISGRSSKFSNKFKSKLGIMLKTPAVTRWNYLFDSITFLNDLFKDGKMNLIQSAISEFNSEKSGSRFSFLLSERELLFVEEFVMVMKPLAYCLDYLQGDSVCIGEMLPAIILNIEQKLKAMDNLNICEPLKERILDALDKRLGIFRHDIKILASTVIHPMFKRFRTQQMLEMTNERFQHIHKYLLNEMKYANRNNCESSQLSINDLPLSKSSSRLNGFFSFENNEESILEEYSLEDELNLLSFYNDKNFSFSIFDNPSYAKIKKVFLKLNTAVTSSGSVERLFSEARNILSLSRSNLKDDIFENMLFLKVNKNYTQSGSKVI